MSLKGCKVRRGKISKQLGRWIIKDVSLERCKVKRDKINKQLHITQICNDNCSNKRIFTLVTSRSFLKVSFKLQKNSVVKDALVGVILEWLTPWEA